MKIIVEKTEEAIYETGKTSRRLYKNISKNNNGE